MRKKAIEEQRRVRRLKSKRYPRRSQRRQPDLVGRQEELLYRPRVDREASWVDVCGDLRALLFQPRVEVVHEGLDRLVVLSYRTAQLLEVLLLGLEVYDEAVERRIIRARTPPKSCMAGLLIL